MPCSWARLHMMSDATEPPRCVWSSASPTSAGSMSIVRERSAAVASRDELAQRLEPRRIDRVRHGSEEAQHLCARRSERSAASTPNRAGITGSSEPWATRPGRRRAARERAASRRPAGGSPTSRRPPRGGAGPARARAPSSSRRPARSRRGRSRSSGTGSASRKAVSSGTVAWNVSGSGVGIPASEYQ